MNFGISIFLIALGAILAFAVNAQVWFLDINIVGWILMIVGLFGLVLSVIWWNNWNRRFNRRNRFDYDDENDVY